MSQCSTCEQDFIFHLYEFIEHCVYNKIPQKDVFMMLNNTIPKMYEEVKKDAI